MKVLNVTEQRSIIQILNNTPVCVLHKLTFALYQNLLCLLSTQDDNLTGLRTITKKALHMLTGHRLVSMQEAVHMVDNQELVICSDSITYVSLSQGQALRDETDKQQKRDLITIYRNRQRHHNHYSLEQYFYQVFVESTFKKKNNEVSKECDIFNVVESNQHRMLIPKGMNCKPQFPVDYNYARGMLIMHKPWNKDNTLDKLLKDQQRTIKEFLRMIDNQEVPTSVRAQYLTAMKYAHQKKIEVLVKEGVNHPDINDDHHDDETRERMTAWLHGSHLTDNKLLDDSINDVTVDIGKDKDWSISDYSELRKTTIDGKEYIQQTTNLFYAQGDDSGNGTKSLKIPLQKNGKEYSLDDLSQEQRAVVLATVDTIVKFLNNDKSYKPLRATVMGCGGTGKSFIINTILTLVRKMTRSNNTVLVGAPSGLVAYNVQGSTLHHLLEIGVSRPEDDVTQKVQDKL